MNFDPGSRSHLGVRDVERFPEETLFHRVARAVCEADVRLPRKELFESWEVAARIRKKLRGTRVVDVGCGHGLTAHMLALLLPDIEEAVAIDRAIPRSAARLSMALSETWPSLRSRIQIVEGDWESLPLHANDVVVSVHGCGALSDRVIERSLEVEASVALLPCCHDHANANSGGLHGWLDRSLAIDAMRAARLSLAGYRVWTQTIPAAITPRNRLILARPVTRELAGPRQT